MLVNSINTQTMSNRFPIGSFNCNLQLNLTKNNNSNLINCQILKTHILISQILTRPISQQTLTTLERLLHPKIIKLVSNCNTNVILQTFAQSYINVLSNVTYVPFHRYFYITIYSTSHQTQHEPKFSSQKSI